MQENKKVRNTKKVFAYGINFKSTVEKRMYEILVKEGITPSYETMVFELVPSIRPIIAFFNRFKKKFSLDMRPLASITYTPDFTFTYNNILCIIEIKGYENDVFPYKKNLFRRHLETLNTPVMYFEVRTQKELYETLRIIKMETPEIQQIRSLMNSLPEADIPKGQKFLQERQWQNLIDLVNSALIRTKKGKAKGITKYDTVDIDSLYQLQAVLLPYEEQEDV